jgi:hypothetical protein
VLGSLFELDPPQPASAAAAASAQIAIPALFTSRTFAYRRRFFLTRWG